MKKCIRLVINKNL